MSIQLNRLTLSIGNKKICDDLTVEFNPGEFWAILGINGVGKSTLLHRMIAVSTAMSDEIIIDDKSLFNYRQHRKLLATKVGLLLQEYEYNFPCSVLEATLIGRHPYLSQWQWESNEDIKIAEDALKQTDLLDLKDRQVNTLSGGEKRRLNLATLLTQDPLYYLLDEPTNHLDLKAQINTLNSLKKLINDNNKAGIMVIHDANLANRYCDNVLMLFGDGEWAAGSAASLINTANLERLYGCTIEKLSNEHHTIYIPG